MKVLTAALIALISNRAQSLSSGKGKEVTDGYNIAVDWDEKTEVVTFTVVMQDLSWLGIVLGSFSHTNSDMILFSANGSKSRFVDQYSTGYFMATNDPVQDVYGAFEIKGTEVVFTVSRKIDTADSQDYLITPGQLINCAWAVNPFTQDPRSKHTLHDRWAFQLDRTPPPVVPTETETGANTDDGSDWLPAGPIAVKPEYDLTYLNIPNSMLTLTNYIESVGWVLDGANSEEQGNSLALQKWWDEIATEQGSTWLNEQYQYALSGWALYGEIKLNAGWPLAIGDYLIAGIQTNLNVETYRAARVDAVLTADLNGKKNIQYFTSTYQDMNFEMGFDDQPIDDAIFATQQVYCNSNFGPNACSGLEGSFGQDFQSATNDQPGLWRIWLWLPNQSHKSYFKYDLKQGDEVAVFVGTYNNTNFGTQFDSGYWQYGAYLTLSEGNYLQFTLTALSSVLLCLF